jgi:dTDP-4-amino-4,6-dideoxygalactose transaminase
MLSCNCFNLIVRSRMTKPIVLLDLKAQYAAIREEITAAITQICEGQTFVLGEPVARLEREIADYCHTSHAVGCASGSDAILLALKALGVGQGDEVLTVPYSFFATAGYIVHTGAQPVFVDIEPDTFNMNPALIEDALYRHPKVKVIMPVHLFGQCADMDPILAIAKRRGLAVVEDAAQSIGAEYKGRRAGSMGAIGCLSFYPGKNLGAFGDAGMMTLDDVTLDANLRALRLHGGFTKYVHEWVGWNSRLDALQATVLSVKLRYLDQWTAARQRNADLYRQLIPPDIALTPTVAGYNTRHVHNQFVIRSQRRDALREHLTAQGIGTEIYYPIPLHLQKCFAYLGYREGDFPESERAARETLALPVHTELQASEIERVAEAVIAGSAAAAPTPS